MALITIVLVLLPLITFIDAQQDTKLDNDINNKVDQKRAGFLPSRGRRFWSIFDWDDSGEKRAGFLPMRGRKAGFLPMRGKKAWDNYPIDDYVDVDPILNAENDSKFDNELGLDKRASFMPMRGKKAFHAMRGKKSVDQNYNNVLDKRSRAFFGSRG